MCESLAKICLYFVLKLEAIRFVSRRDSDAVGIDEVFVLSSTSLGGM